MKPKPVNWSSVDDDSDVYEIMNNLLRMYHSDLSEKSLVVVPMWRHGWKIDADRYLTLAEISKSPDKYRELREHDLILGVNKIAWSLLDQVQKEVVIGTQLARVAIATDKAGNVKEDDNSRTIFRLKREQSIDSELMIKRYGGVRCVTLTDVIEFVVSKTEEELKENDQEHPLVSEDTQQIPDEMINDLLA